MLRACSDARRERGGPCRRSTSPRSSLRSPTANHMVATPRRARACLRRAPELDQRTILVLLYYEGLLGRRRSPTRSASRWARSSRGSTPRATRCGRRIDADARLPITSGASGMTSGSRARPHPGRVAGRRRRAGAGRRRGGGARVRSRGTGQRPGRPASGGVPSWWLADGRSWAAAAVVLVAVVGCRHSSEAGHVLPAAPVDDPSAASPVAITDPAARSGRRSAPVLPADAPEAL